MNPHSFIYIHVAFSTRAQAPLIADRSRAELYSYIRVLGEKMSSPLLAIGGTSDHVHLLIHQSDDISMQTLVDELRDRSSEMMQGEQPEFAWQESWFGFTISPEEVAPLEQYIEHQEEQHEMEDFKDEMRRICRENGIEVNEVEMWE